jgi:hypothetical protein
MSTADSTLTLAGYTFAHAAWNISDLPKGDLLCPLAMVEESGQRQLLRFESESQQGAIALGKATLARREHEFDSWAFAREGLFREGSGSVDVLIVEAKSRGEALSVVFVQRFQPFASGRFKLLGVPMVLIGERALSIEEAEPYLARLYVGVQAHSEAAELWNEWSTGEATVERGMTKRLLGLFGRR